MVRQRRCFAIRLAGVEPALRGQDVLAEVRANGGFSGSDLSSDDLISAYPRYDNTISRKHVGGSTTKPVN
jgi:hypothetical protein